MKESKSQWVAVDGKAIKAIVKVTRTTYFKKKRQSHL